MFSLKNIVIILRKEDNMVVEYIGGSLNGRREFIMQNPLPKERRYFNTDRNVIEVYVLVITAEHLPTYQYTYDESPRRAS